MNIVFDLDDTLFFNYSVRDTSLKFKIPRSEYYDLRDYDEEAYSYWRSLIDSSEYMHSLSVPKKGPALIKELSKNHEIYCVTARPKNFEAKTKELVKKFYPEIKETFLESDKENIFRELKINMVFDDKYENLISAKNASVKYNVLISGENNLYNHKHRATVQLDENIEIIENLNYVFENEKIQNWLKK